MPSYSKEQSAFKPPKKEAEAKVRKPIRQVSEKKAAAADKEKSLYTAAEFNAAAKKVKKEKSAAKKLQKPKSTPVSEIKKYLDVIYSCVVRMEPAGPHGHTHCVTCGSLRHWSSLQNGHFIKRSIAPSLIFNRNNVAPQCVRCNVLLEGNRIPYVRYMEFTYGKESVALLELQGQNKSKMGAFEYQIMLQEYIEKFLVQCNRLNHTPTKIQQKIVDKWRVTE